MKPWVGRAVLLLALVGAAAAHAQDVPRRARAPRPPVPPTPRPEALAVPAPPALPGILGGTGVEVVLRMKEELDLTEPQVMQLEAIRKEEVTRRQNESREMIDLESRYQAGLIERDAWRSEMERRSDARTAAARSVRDRIEKILTREQRDQLEERRYRRAGIDGRLLLERLERDRLAPSARWWPGEPRFERLPELNRLRPYDERFRLWPFDDRIREFAPRPERFRWERRGIL